MLKFMPLSSSFDTFFAALLMCTLFRLLKEPNPSPDIAPTVFAKQAVIDRIKRCCCTYVEVRKERLQKLRWKLGGILTDEIKQNLSAEEHEWFSTYGRIISNFQCTIGGEDIGVNLLDHTNPPKKLFRQVKVLQDYGEYETMDGNIKLLKRDSVVSLIIYFFYNDY